MARSTLDVIVEKDPSGGWLARSPAVGVWTAFPVAGQALESGGAGVLTQGTRRIELRLPAEVSGRVSAVYDQDRKAIPVEWGQRLFALASTSSAANADTPELTGAGVGAAAGDVLVAPTDGVFYSRSSPDAEPFVRSGDTLTRGQAIGLIEVMKTFNHVLFSGDGLPDSAIVEAFLVDDGEELTSGKPILRFKPTT